MANHLSSRFLLSILFLLPTYSSALTKKESLLQKAIVWERPTWIQSDFSFAPGVDYLKATVTRPNDQYLMKDVVRCQITEEQLEKSKGKSPKFKCLLKDENGQVLMSPKGKPDDIKVKYLGRIKRGEKISQEVYGEVLGTRLFNVLGFKADSMFYIPQLKCMGCTEEPFRDDSITNVEQTFNPVAVERKFSGSEMIFPKKVKEWDLGVGPRAQPRMVEVIRPIEGWSFKELIQSFSEDPVIQQEQRMHREALRLLAVFVQHKDLKDENNRIVCQGELSNDKLSCDGKIYLLVQDLGATFGVGVSNLGLYKVNYERWKSQPVWKDASICKADLSVTFMPDSSMKDPVISEAGRKFLADLLMGFIAGAEGRHRVETLFREAHIDERGRGETIDMWVDVFMDRAKQIIYPMGPNQPHFKCP